MFGLCLKSTRNSQYQFFLRNVTVLPNVSVQDELKSRTVCTELKRSRSIFKRGGRVIWANLRKNKNLKDHNHDHSHGYSQYFGNYHVPVIIKAKTSNKMQNIKNKWNKVEKSSEIRKDQHTLISVSVWILAVMTKLLFLEGRNQFSNFLDIF